MEIKKNLVKESNYSIKCPYSMTATRIVVHNTANDASAKNEISYMIGNANKVSFHIAVDDVEAVQGIPFNRNTWNAGDGNGKGNREGISIEICYSKSGGAKFTKAEQNAAKLIAQLLKERNWGIDKVTKHQDYSGKYCPHRTLDLGWQRFLDMVKKEMGTTTAPKPTTPTTSSTKYSVGDTVEFSGLATSSTASSHTTKISVKKGKITKVVKGAKYPYLIDSNTGWVNDSIITKKASASTNTGSTSNTSYYKKYTGKSTKIDEVFKAVGAPYGNYKKRKPVADKNGVKNYSGTASQNLSLIKLAKNGKLKKV